MAAPKVLRFPEDLATKKSTYKNNYIKFLFYDRTKNKNFGYKNVLQSNIVYPIIYLPLTTDIFREILTASYGNQNLGILGNLIFNEAKMDINNVSADSIVQTLKNAVTSEVAKNQLKTYLQTTALTADIEAVQSARHAEGLAYNPNITVFFRGELQNYRFFRLGWTLFPRTENEAEVLLQIEKVLLRNSLPGTVNSANTMGLNYNNNYTYPYEVQMEVYVDDVHFQKFKFMPSIVQYVDFSHHDSQQQNEMSFLKKGDTGRLLYASTTINLGIQEKEVFVRQYIDELKENTTVNPLNFAPQ